MLKALPILFNGAMVRAIMDGTKTQTRRIMNEKQCKIVSDIPAAEYESLELQGWEISDGSECDGDYSLGDYLFKVPVSVGDLLYVRENWQAHSWASDCVTIRYAAQIRHVGFTGQVEQIPYPNGDKNAFKFYSAKGPNYWRPSIHMPRWASRTTLEVTDVRVQRLQDISKKDARSEGIKFCSDRMAQGWLSYEDQGNPHHTRYFSDPRNSFETLWRSINDKREGGKFAWAKNPWVAAYTFEPIFENVDAVIKRQEAVNSAIASA